MQKTTLAGLATIALTGGTLLATEAPAQATVENLYVNQAAANCSDQGPGAKTEPFCTIGAAAAVVTAGQTVWVAGGSYPERVTIPASGTYELPIGFIANGPVTLTGPTAGFVVDGQHNIGIQDFRINGAAAVPALDIRNSSYIEVVGGNFTMASSSTAPAVRLAGLAGAILRDLVVSGTALTDGLTMDAATSDVQVTNWSIMTGPKYDDHSVGIRVDGPRNTILDNIVSGFTGGGVALGPGATDTVVANNRINGGGGHGIHNGGATGTAITNNTVRDRCLDGIRVDGASAGVSVQNNVLTNNGSFSQSYCDPTVTDGVEIGVHGPAMAGTVVDYNNAHHHSSPSSTSYSWNGARMGLTQFRTVSGQAAHDRDTPNTRDNQDSANSAAPGYQEYDAEVTSRADNPAVPNTGAGPVTYADRGAIETVAPPVASFDVALDLGASKVTVDASASTPGFVPIESYRFEFGDGTVVTQTTPVASHKYATPGSYRVTVKATGTDGQSGTSTEQVSVLRRTATVGLLALANLRYVGSSTNLTALQPNQAGLSTSAQFDLADAGGGQVALFSRASGRYVTEVHDTSLTATSQVVDTREKFTLIRNGDGTSSLRAGSGRYVTAAAGTSSALTANRTTIGTAEKFHRVTVTDAFRSLKARANARYVTAESAGTKPLIARGTAIGLWERYDVVDLGNGQAALFARANNRFVTAASGGAQPLIANRAAVSTWERFTLVRNADGTVSFKAAANGRYVTADSAGTKPLIANRTSIGSWEKFTLG
ncbi:PKD domain-containing protein [Micromonospora sp. CPCC 205556]|uniref:PKD domain-containing protein n=1 Tax=Micromonospora sp. CPCC 205556 TaxID=3122398 RepID=UPI002FEE6CA3